MTELNLKIVTPDRVFYDGPIVSVTARGMMGDFTILKNHAPFVTVLDIRKIKIKDSNGERRAAIAGGYIIVKDNNVTIMSDACEWEEEIDKSRAEKARERAEKRLKASNTAKDQMNAEIALKKAINRLELGN